MMNVSAVSKNFYTMRSASFGELGNDLTLR